MYIKTRCPQCGMIDDMDDSRQFQYCRYCGKQVNIREAAYGAQVTAAAPNTPAAPEQANLTIQYYSINPGVTMIVRFPFSGQMQYFISGQSFSFHIPYGSHRISLQIGRRNYARNIFLPDNNGTVNIYASWDGRAHIEIVNPPYTPPAPVQQVVYVPVQMPMNTPAPAPAPANGKTCPQCGTANEPNFLFCIQCGTRLAAKAPKDVPVESKPDAPLPTQEEQESKGNVTAPVQEEEAKDNVTASVQEEQAETVCENCGRTLHNDETFCPGCGAKNPNATE